MRNIIITLVLSLCIQLLLAQGNCNLYEGQCKVACELSYEAKKGQGSKRSQELFDQCVELCPTFAYAYFEKSVPYLKQGLFEEWKRLMDLAVRYDQEYLLQRGINQIQFMRNYKAGLDDLNLLVEIKNSADIGYSPSGAYHAQIIRAICYQKLGNLPMAISLIEDIPNLRNFHSGLYDDFHVGIIYMEAGQLDKAKEAFDRQLETYEYAETHYYYAQLYGKLNDTKSQRKSMEKADQLYKEGKIISGSYYHYIDKVFQVDITEALNNLR